MGDRGRGPGSRPGSDGRRKRPSIDVLAAQAAPLSLQPHRQEIQSPSPPSTTFRMYSFPHAVPASPLTTTPVHPSSSTLQPRPPKVPIPRLHQESDAASVASLTQQGSERSRVGHACEPCRSRKTKCSGERPTCGHCREHALLCVYGDGKRDRAKKEMGSLRERLEEYERLLENLSLQGDSATQLAIQKVLRKSSSSPKVESTSKSKSFQMRKATREQDLDGVLDGEPEGEDLVGADAGSTGSADCVEDDFACDDETFSAGFLGKCTEVSWMQRIAERMEAEQIPPEVETSLTAESRQLPEGPPSGQPTWREQTSSALTGHQEPKLSDFTYQADDFALPAPDQINELELPPRQIADLFVNAYFTTVHSSFPILRKKDFFRAYEQCFIPYAKPINRRWRAILNLVLAIGAKYTVLTGADNCDERDHWTFFARARSLSLDNGALWHLGDLEQVQVTGLATLYLIATEHINRAWHVCGLAVRYAYALALHLRNESQNMSDIQKEFRVRLWWSIYSLERLLEVRTGRPSAIDDPDVSAALPIPVEEDSFPTDHDRLYRYEYQPDRVKPTRFRRPDGQSKSPGGSARSSRPGSSKSTGATSTSASPSVISDLSPSQSSVRIGSSDSISRVVPVPNSATFFTHQIRLNMITHEICKSIFSASALGLSWANLQKKVGDFQDGLSQWRSDLPNLFNFQQRHRDQVFVRERLSLGLHYWSAVILATRPCLCKSAGRIPNESSKARDADMVAARTCVHAATEIINFLPDEPNPTGIYGVAPWWSLLHHLVQAASVLMIELSLRVEHVPDEAQQLLANSKKAVRWLWSMGERSTSSGRAWRTMDHLLHRVAPLVGGDTSDIPGINPNAALPFMCEATPYGVPQLYHHAIRHHSAHEINLPTAEMGLDIPPHFGIDPVYQPVNFSPNPYDQMDLHSRTFPDTDLMFPVTEDRENMDIGGHQ